MAGKDLVPIGQVDSSGTLYANPSALALPGNTGITGGGIFAQSMPGGMPTGMAPAAMQQPVIVLQGGGGGGFSSVPWKAIEGGFLTVAGLFQRANLNSLQEDVSDAEDEYKTANTAAEAALAAYAAAPNAANDLAWRRSQQVLNAATRKVNDAQTALEGENARSALYTTVGGVGDLAQSFAGGTYPGIGGFSGGQQVLMAAPQMAAPQMMMAPQMMAAPQIAYMQMAGGGWAPVLTGFMGGVAGGLLTNALTSDKK